MAKGRAYPEEMIAEARALYEQFGPGETARRLDVPRATVSGWAHTRGWQTERKANIEAAVEAARAGRAEKRERVIALALLNAERALERAYESSDAKATFNLNRAASDAIRNFALLSGEATSRSGAEDDEAAIKRLIERATERIQREDAERSAA